MQFQKGHLFSLFTPNLKLNSWQNHQIVEIHDEQLLHRMIKVLRFASGDQVIFFDTQYFVRVLVQEIFKKSVIVQVQTVLQHQSLTPQVTFLLPLLKKEALEQAVYSLCELGVNKIQLVITQKSRPNLLHDKEFVRLQNIVIAAAEQSKNYSMSELLAPKKLLEICNDLKSDFKIVFDPQGASFFDVRAMIKNAASIHLLVGPEGGLTFQELEFVQKNNFVFCALTPTVLTAVQAVALGAGLMRLK